MIQLDWITCYLQYMIYPHISWTTEKIDWSLWIVRLPGSMTFAFKNPGSFQHHWGNTGESWRLPGCLRPILSEMASHLATIQTSSDLQLPGSEDDCASDWWIVLETFRHWLDGLLGISVHAGGAIPSPKSLRRLAFGSSGSHFGQVLGKKTFSKLKLGFIDIELK